jgi:hypothetical protein
MKKSILVAAIVAVIGLFGVGLYTINQPDTSVDNSAQTTEQSTEQNTKATFSEDGKIVEYQGVEGATALTTLKTLTDVNTEKSDYGEFVTSINGVQANSKKEYWSFYVNGKYSDEGAGTYKAKAGDNFKWQLEQLQ